jgi:hypothetical protein
MLRIFIKRLDSKVGSIGRSRSEQLHDRQRADDRSLELGKIDEVL